MLASMANRGASSSSAPFTKSWKYHVFLCFRGEDTRHNFTDHLYSALCQQGINTFRDDDELRRGEETSSALLTAIEKSKISVVVFSKNYASSKSCLDELVKILDCKESNQQLVMPVFYKVNPSDIRNHRGSFGDALANMDCNNVEKINRWKEALSQAGKLAGFTLSDEHRSEAELIHKIVQRISREVIDRTYLYVTEYPVGMHHPVEDITKLLDFGEKDVLMVGIWGIGGIGKTTIAKAVYNSIVHEFEGSCFLENVRERAMWQRGGLAKLQENLLSDILRGNFFEVPNVHIGATMIRERLSGRKILLVLDDVDDMEQLHKLVGACDWFGAGSRIIITTRDKQLLTAHDVNLIHEVKILDYYKALELFCWHAFKRSGPPLGDYVKLAERALRYAQGLPLALKVLGSCLYGGSIDIWEAALHGFKSPKIQDVLKISYNALDHSVQQVFLDIACFFKGKSRMRLTKIVVACDPKARYSIEVLMEKALISVEGDYIWMHDLLEEMGKDIVQQESPDEPGGRSKLWSHEDIEHVLTNDTGTEKITGIMLNSPEMDYEIFLDVDCFLKMKNLKIFMNYNVCLSGNIGYLPNMLRVLNWHRCPLQSFPPNFRPKGLVVLNLPCSHIKQLREGLKHFTKLTSLNLEWSKFLTEIPDLSGNPNLRYLNASYCESLVEVHPSVGYLDKLQVLDFCGCRELTKFPNKVWWKSLERLGLSNCKKLESFPEIVDKMESLIELDLGRTAIKELPASIGHLIGLEILRLSESAIKELPASIGHLIGLKILVLSGRLIKELPFSIGHLTALEALSLKGTAIEELPSSVKDLTVLEILDLEGCENLTNLPQIIYGLKKLNRCLKLVTFPNKLISEVLSSVESLPLEVRTNANSPRDGDLLSLWSNLTIINLSNSNFVSLPVCISKCVNLQWLDLSGCKKLVEILGQLPASIESINMADCISLERFSTLSKILEDGDMQHIDYMNLSNCHRLCDNIGLDTAKMANILVKQPAVNTGHFINVLLPGSEVPESFSFRKDVGLLLPNNNDHLLDFPIEIPWTSLLENMVLCTVCEPTESFIRPCFPGLSLSNLIDGVWGFPGDDYSVSEGLTGAGHVELRYIPLPARTKRKRALHRIIHVSYRGGRGLFKSFGADLSRNSMPKDGFGFCSMPEDGDDDENEDEDELDDVGDEVRPRKRKKTTSLCISMHQSDPKFIQNIIEEISKYVLNRVPLEVAEHPVGMQPQIQVMNKLLDLRENDVRMIGVWGTGGIGMTTIAKAVYNSIAHKFEGCSFLAKVNVDKGVTMTKEWLRRRKVLLVLDDVDDMEQLHRLVGACDWFGVGSRIIITTRDKQLLTAHGVNLIHEVKILDDDKALELFCWHAFKKSEPPLDKWKAALEGFKSPKIQDVLKINYNALDDIVKEVFLKGKSRNYVIEACELNTRYGIDVLIEKALKC
ncbi:unnamed protein product [Prunus armeniaca]